MPTPTSPASSAASPRSPTAGSFGGTGGSFSSFSSHKHLPAAIFLLLVLLGGTFWQVNNSLQSLAPELYTQAEDRPHKNEAAPEAAEAAFQGDLAAPMPMPVVKELLEEEKGNEKEVDKKETDQGKEKDDKQKFEQEKEKAIAMEKKAEEKEKEKEKEEKEKEKKNKDKEDEADEKKDEAEKKDKDIDTATAKPTATEKKEEQTTIIGGPYTKKPLNIMLFYPDDWRHDSIGGVAPIVKTPYLNQLATEGIRFTHNMVTTSICWISRATLFTGQYVSRHKSVSVRRTEFYNTWNTSWPGLLRSHGYYTGHIGKWQYLNPDRFVEKNLFNHTNLFEGSHYFRGKYAADKTRDDTIEFLRNRPKDRPFAMTAAFYPPKAVGMSHEPGAQWTPKPETRAKFYENETIPEPPYNVEESYQKMPWFFHVYEKEGRYRWNQRFNGTHKYQAAMKNYYSLVTEVDQACREIVDELKAQGLYEDTLIIFTADNGLFHSEHGLAGKWYPYQESIRTPFIVRDPRMPKDKHNQLDDSLTLNIDLAPTILAAAGIEPDPGMQGRDIADIYLPPIQERAKDDNDGGDARAKAAVETDPWRHEFFYEFPSQSDKIMPSNSALVQHGYKYIYWPRYKFEQFFNLTADPLEQDDVINKTEYKSLIDEFRTRHDQYKKEVGKAYTKSGKK